MEKNKKINMAGVMVVILAGLISVSEGAVFKVGNSAGWTIMGNVNYSLWSSSIKTFSVGDTALFTYNKNFHNVMEVSKADYKSCNAASPISTYSTGNDSIVIKTPGHHYFICGFPGHCAIGQKVDIMVGKLSSAAPSMAPTTSLAPAPTSGGADSGNSTGSTDTPALSPHANGAASNVFSIVSGFVFIVVSFCF